MTCLQCGHPLLADDKFCTNCGANITQDEVQDTNVADKHCTPNDQQDTSKNLDEENNPSDYLSQAQDLSNNLNSNEKPIMPVDYFKPKTPLLDRLCARLIPFLFHVTMTLALFPFFIVEMKSFELLAMFLYFYGSFLLYFLLQASIQAIFGNTLGKFLFSIKITSPNTYKISFFTYLKRELAVFAQGCWFGLFPPFNILVALYIALKYGKTTSWDFRSIQWEVRYERPHIIRRIIGYSLILLQVIFYIYAFT